MAIAAIAMVGCAHRVVAEPTLDGAWRLHDTIALTQTLNFTSDDRADGEAGCNRWSATIEERRDGVLRFGPILATKRGCADEAWNRAEQLFLVMLAKVRAYRLTDGDRLQLLDAQDAVLATFHH